MKISIVGGGPGGLYFALLAKKEWPDHEVRVLERNGPADTFGFGVVFSDETLGIFRDGVVQIDRAGMAKQLMQVDLLGRAGQQIDATDHLGHALQSIIDCHRQMIS